MNMLVGQSKMLTQREGKSFPNTGPGFAGAVPQEKQVLLPEVTMQRKEDPTIWGRGVLIIMPISQE